MCGFAAEHAARGAIARCIVAGSTLNPGAFPMPRMTIQQFRDVLAGRTHPGGPVGAYRVLARRPDLATGMRSGDWIVWTARQARAATRRDVVAGTTFTAWGDWAGPPARG